MGSGERLLVPSAECRTNVVGEINYQPAIWRALGVEPTAEDDREHVLEVVLVHEPMNPCDPDAIAVRSLDGETLGYLPRALAAMVRLDEPLTVDATVSGGVGFGIGGDDITPLKLALHVCRQPT